MSVLNIFPLTSLNTSTEGKLDIVAIRSLRGLDER